MTNETIDERIERIERLNDDLFGDREPCLVRRPIRSDSAKDKQVEGERR